MDWAAFFKDSSQAIFTLAGVFLGSFITFLISYLNNRFEAKERDKDREEKRKEAGIQAREKWIERDILRIMDSVEILLKLHPQIPSRIRWIKYLQHQTEEGFLTKEEATAKLKLHREQSEKFDDEIHQTMDTMNSLAYSLNDAEIQSKAGDLINSFNDYLEHVMENSYEEIDFDLWTTAKVTAGELRKALREKMIEIRNSE